MYALRALLWVVVLVVFTAGSCVRFLCVGECRATVCCVCVRASRTGAHACLARTHARRHV